MDIINKERFYGALLGLACGDALGAPVEFLEKDTFQPINDMIDGGAFDLKAGQWTDDTSMALCLAVSLIEKKGFDPFDQMYRYCLWLDEGYLSSIDKCFDVGIATQEALYRFKQTRNPYSGSSDPKKAGNGSLMRLVPIPLFYAHDKNLLIEYAEKSSITTHATIECIDACKLYGFMIYMALHGATKEQIILENNFYSQLQSENIKKISQANFINKSREQINGEGYVVLSLEAALWCFWQGASFEECVLLAVNLGADADTTAAICGQLAGAYYGKNAIPKKWYQQLAKLNLLENIAEQLYQSYLQSI